MRPLILPIGGGLLLLLCCCGDADAAASCRSLFSPAGAALILSAYLGSRVLRRKPRRPT